MLYPISAHGSHGCYSETGEQHHSFGLYPVTHIIYVGDISPASFPSWFRVPLTSLSTQNRLYSVNTSLIIADILIVIYHTKLRLIRESVADWWFSPSLRTCHLGFPYDLPYVFLPLLASFRSACHAHRFRSRCSHTVLYIHYKIASQHWGIAAPNYGSFYRTS